MASTFVEVVGGLGQSIYAGHAFQSAITALVTDAKGHPLPSSEVVFTIPTGQEGSVTGSFAGGVLAATASTDSQGDAVSPIITAGMISGMLTVTVVCGDSAIQSVQLLILGPAKVTIASGDGQSVSRGQQYPSLLSVNVLDGNGNTVPDGILVTFSTPPAMDASFDGGPSTTAGTTNGVATATPLRAGAREGSLAVTATAAVSGTATPPSTTFQETVTS